MTPTVPLVSSERSTHNRVGTEGGPEEMNDRLVYFYFTCHCTCMLMKMPRLEQFSQGSKFKLGSHIHNKIYIERVGVCQLEVGEIHLQYKEWIPNSNQLIQLVPHAQRGRKSKIQLTASLNGFSQAMKWSEHRSSPFETFSLPPPTLQMVPLEMTPTVHLKEKVSLGQVG